VEKQMRGFVIGDTDMVSGFQLVGVKGKEAHSLEEAKQLFSDALKREDLAILIISEDFSSQMRKEIDETRLNLVSPLIVELPGRFGPKGEISMSEIVTKALGVRI
jgi:vacuolar-type H+-ATPase subunit F/Vma7